MTAHIVLPNSERSRGCLAGRHADCRHIVGGGGGIHGWRFRATLTVCPCPCHADCPLTDAEPAESIDLYRRCTCADHSAVIAGSEQLEARGAQIRQAIATVQPNAGGKSREQIKTALAHELRNRNVGDVLDEHLDLWATQLDAAANEQGLRRTTGILGAHARFYGTFWDSFKQSANRRPRKRP